MIDQNTFQPKTRQQWREWLKNSHDKRDEIWVQIYKKSSGMQTVTFAELLDEALSFGWIDNREKGIDGQTYAIRFTPRKNKKIWSELNRKRYKELLAQGRVTKYGKAVWIDAQS